MSAGMNEVGAWSRGRARAAPERRGITSVRRVTTVLAQRVVHARANRQGLVTRSVALGYSPASPLRATLGVSVSTPYGAVAHAVAVLLQPAPRARQR